MRIREIDTSFQSILTENLGSLRDLELGQFKNILFHQRPGFGIYSIPYPEKGPVTLFAKLKEGTTPEYLPFLRGFYKEAAASFKKQGAPDDYGINGFVLYLKNSPLVVTTFSELKTMGEYGKILFDFSSLTKAIPSIDKDKTYDDVGKIYRDTSEPGTLSLYQVRAAGAKGSEISRYSPKWQTVYVGKVQNFTTDKNELDRSAVVPFEIEKAKEYPPGTIVSYEDTNEEGKRVKGLSVRNGKAWEEKSYDSEKINKPKSDWRNPYWVDYTDYGQSANRSKSANGKGHTETLDAVMATMITLATAAGELNDIKIRGFTKDALEGVLRSRWKILGDQKVTTVAQLKQLPNFNENGDVKLLLRYFGEDVLVDVLKGFNSQTSPGREYRSQSDRPKERLAQRLAIFKKQKNPEITDLRLFVDFLSMPKAERPARVRYKGHVYSTTPENTSATDGSLKGSTFANGKLTLRFKGEREISSYGTDVLEIMYEFDHGEPMTAHAKILHVKASDEYHVPDPIEYLKRNGITNGATLISRIEKASNKKMMIDLAWGVRDRLGISEDQFVQAGTKAGLKAHVDKLILQHTDFEF